MGLQKMINRSAAPAGKPATLRGKPAQDYHFQTAGLTHAHVRIHSDYQAASKPLDEEPAGEKGFEPLRLVVNLFIKDKANQAATRFAEPFELRIRYTDEDVNQAGGRENLKLAYWVDQHWIVLNNRKHNFKIEDNEFLFAELSSWPSDPPIAVGH